MFAAPATLGAAEAPFVISLLDVVGKNDDPRTGVSDTLRLLDIAVTRAEPVTLPNGGTGCFWQFHGLALRYAVSAGVTLSPQIELRRLKDELKVRLGLAASGARSGVARAPQRLIVLVEHRPAEFLFELVDHSREWLEGVLGRRLPRLLRVRHDVHQSFREIYGDPYPEYAHALTTMAVDEIMALAGIEFRGPNGHLEWSSDGPADGRI